MVGSAQILDLRQYGSAVRRQHNAAPVAAEQRDAQLALQRCDGGLMPDWVKFSASAALVKVPQDTTFKNT